MEPIRNDPVLGPLVEEHGELAVEPHDAPFERLVVSVIRQQVSMDAGAAIRERLFDAIEVSPEGVLAADEQVMRDAGLSAAKVEYLGHIAEAFQDDLSVDEFHEMEDAAVRDALTDIHGVGDWTASMFLIFGLGREDVFPVGDLGIRKGMRALFDDEMTRGEMRERAERWRPYRSYASRYVWRAYDG